MKPLAFALLLPIAFTGCMSSSSDPSDENLDDDKADGTSTATYFDCEGFGTANTTWLAISRTQRTIKLTIEDVGVNTGHLAKTTSTARTYGRWSTNVFLQSGDTLDIPKDLVSSGAGKITWKSAGTTTRWIGTCTKKQPSGDQCLPLIKGIDPVDSSATPKYATVSPGHYTVTVPNSTVGDFVYAVTMNISGILCTTNDMTPTSCSAVVANAISDKAYGDGASSGAPYVSKRTKITAGYSWSGGVHDVESGDFAYTVTTDSDADGCHVLSIK
jgi:hypothetical protein